MTLPEPVARHKSTLFLVFPPKCAPLAELACWHHCTSKPNIRIGLDSDLLSTAPKLIIPSGPMAPVRTVLSGKATIARYLARHDPLLYNESDDAIKLVTDTMLDTISFESDPKKIALHIAAYCKGKQGDTLGLADFYAWDYATHNPSGLEECLARWNEIKLLQNVKKQVADTLFAQPVLDEYKRVVAQQISKILNVPLNRVYESFLEPRDKNTADLSIAMPFFRLPGNPAQMAKDIASKYESCDLISNSSHTGIFVNFLFNRRKYYSQTLTQALTMAESYGTNTSALGNLAVVEFSSPNIAKPFHAGHLRSTIIGNFCKNILAANGCSTLSMNYLGDWGKQYGLLAVGFERFGNEEALQADPIQHLYEVYVKINEAAAADETVHDIAREYFKRMELGEADALALWQRFRDLSIVKYKEMYARLNISFDVYCGESQYSLDQMQEVLEELQAKDLLVPENGALMVDLREYGIGTAVIGKTDGTMLYLSRDIAAARDRQKEFDFDSMYYIVAMQQDHHFKQLFKILELQGKTWAQKCHYIGFGMIEGMSTRKGTVVFLKDILDQTQEEMHSVMKKNEKKYAQIEDPVQVSDVVGMSSIMIQDMAARRVKDYTFDWSRMLSFEGDTGPYLQYAHARLCSIERGCPLKLDAETLNQVNFELLKEPQADSLMDWIAVFPSIVVDAAKNKEPVSVVKYCLRLSQRVSTAVSELYVLHQAPDIALARLAMYTAARITLGNALKLLGLNPLQRM